MADNNTWLSPEERAALARQREMETARRAAVQNRAAQTAPRTPNAGAAQNARTGVATAPRPNAAQPAQHRPAQTVSRPVAQRGGVPSGVRQGQRTARPSAPVRPGEVTGDTKELPRYIHSAKRGGHKPPQKIGQAIK